MYFMLGLPWTFMVMENLSGRMNSGNDLKGWEESKEEWMDMLEKTMSHGQNHSSMKVGYIEILHKVQYKEAHLNNFHLI